MTQFYEGQEVEVFLGFQGGFPGIPSWRKATITPRCETIPHCEMAEYFIVEFEDGTHAPVPKTQIRMIDDIVDFRAATGAHLYD